MGRVCFLARAACPPPFPVLACGVGVRAGPGSCGPCPPIPFGLGCWLFFFFSWCESACFGVPFPGGPVFLAWFCGFWLRGPPVPLLGSCLRCLLGGGLAASGGVGGRFGGCGLFSRPPPPPSVFFGGGGGLPVPSSAFPGLAHASARIQCCLPGCCWLLRSVWPCSGHMGRVGYVHVGLGAPSCRARSWLCRLGGCTRRLLVALGWGAGVISPFPSAVPVLTFWVVRHRCCRARCGPVCGLRCRCVACWCGAFRGVRWLASVSPSG